MHIKSLSEVIANKLQESKEELKSFYHENNSNTDTRYFFIDNLLDPSITKEIYSSFPNEENLNFRDTTRI